MAIQDHLSNSDKPSQYLFMLDSASSASAFDISNNWPLLSQHQHHHHHHHHQFQDSPHPPGPRDPNFDRAIGFGIIPSNPRSITTHHQSTASAIDFDHLHNLQNERFRLAMVENRKQQMSQLVKKYEWKAQILLQHKEEEMGMAANRASELEDYLKRMEIERQAWEREAKENEAMAASLSATLGGLRESPCLLLIPNPAVEDAESCCENNTQEEFLQDKTTPPMICRCCNSRKSCMVMLPCRHLCCCKQCELFLHSCPLCAMLKKDTIEALI